jgi:hypothetical protein
MERIMRLTKDNEAARLPRLAEEVKENLLSVEDYGSYMRIRRLEPGAFAVG